MNVYQTLGVGQYFLSIAIRKIKGGDNALNSNPFKVAMGLALILVSVLLSRHGRHNLRRNQGGKGSIPGIKKVKVKKGSRGLEVGGYLLGPVLGRGSFGEVYKATKDGREYAIKVSKHLDQSGLESFSRELDAMRAFQGVPAVVQLVNVMQAEGKVYVVMPLAKGDVDKLMKAKKLDKRMVHGIFKQLIEAVEGIHARGWCHRDIKPENLLCMDDGCREIALSDFGTASNKTSFTVPEGTPAYTSPDAFSGKEAPYDGKLLDIWSCGVALYEMLTYNLPFTGKHAWDMEKDIKTKPLVCPAGMDPDACELIKRMLEKNPGNRISIQGIKQSDYWNHRWKAVQGFGVHNRRRHARR